MTFDPSLNLLVSFHYWKERDMDHLLEVLAGVGLPYSLFADSGAYSAMTLGKPVVLDEYNDWIRRYENVLTCYAQLDVIQDVKGTAENLERMRDAGLNPVPAYHVGGAGLERFEQLRDEYAYIAVGGAVGYDAGSARQTRYFLQLFKQAQGTQFHGFGLTRWNWLKEFPWFTCDSTTWVNTFKYGAMQWFNPHTARFDKLLTKGKSVDLWAKRSSDFRLLGIDWRDFAAQERFPRHSGTLLSFLSYKRAEAWLHKYHDQDRVALDRSKIVPTKERDQQVIYLAILPTTLKNDLNDGEVLYRYRDICEYMRLV